jgi:O-antigen/teichoic acid export membrane protein
MSTLQKIKQFLFSNTSSGQIIVKNTIWLFGGQLISRLLRIAIVIYAARVLGVESWGAFSYALGIAAFLTIFSDIGINALITREASRNPEMRDQYLATAFFTKLGLLTFFVIGVIFFFPYLTTIEEAIIIMPILIFVFAFDTIRDLGSALSRALEKMEIEASVTIFTNFTIVVLGFLLLYQSPTSTSLAYAYTIGSGLGLIVIWYSLRNHLNHLFKNFKGGLIKPILGAAWPFGLLGLIGAITLNTDIIMLGWMKSAHEVGLYAAAQKPIQLLYIIPTLIATSIFPRMAKFAKTDRLQTRHLLTEYGSFLVLFSIPIILLGILFGGSFMHLLFGQEYASATLTFQILMFTIAIVYPSILVANAIFAYNEQRQFVRFVFTALFGNILFNLLLIPSFGIEGAAISTILTQLITNTLMWRAIKKVNGFSVFSLFRQIPNTFKRLLQGNVL